MLSSSYEDRLRGFELTIGPIRHTYRTSVPVETAEHINDLNVSYPPDTDPQGEAAAHLRMIKATLKATFPNVDGPVSASADDLSSLFVMPVGVVVPFFLPSAEVPTGWALCNGQTVARSDGSGRSEEHTSELQSLMRISYAVFCFNNKNKHASIQPQ